MFRINGFYGHVRRNDLRSVAMFVGFVLAFQLVSAVALFVPLLFLDISRAPLWNPLGYMWRYVPFVFVLGVVLFVVRFSRHVASVQTTVDFVYVDRRADSRLVNIVETTAIMAGLPAPKVGIIETPARNAFACGLRASSAVVVVTRGLLDALDDDELTAVVAHEIAHIRNGDIRLMAAANVLMENLSLVQRRNVLRGIGWKMALLVVFMPALLLLFGFAGILTRAAFTAARVSRLLISSSREFVADAEAVRLTHNPSALISALRRIEGRSAVSGLSPQSDAMMIDGAVEGPFATHPTIAERISILARLSGDWVESEIHGKDARSLDVHTRAPGLWGTPADGPTVPEPSRLLVRRVNAGTKENIYGMTPGAKRVVKIGLAFLAAIQVWAIIQAGSSKPGSSGAAKSGVHAIQDPTISPRHNKNDPLVSQASPSQLLQQLAVTNPVEAQCFATEHYQVGDRGVHKLRTPNPGLVEAYSRGELQGSSEITIERYLGLKARSTRAVAGAGDAELDQALLDYVETRKMMLKLVHRFFGDAGLSLMRQAYDSAEDSAIVANLRLRLQSGDPALRADSRVMREMELLISAPQAFIPCVARLRTATRTSDVH